MASTAAINDPPICFSHGALQSSRANHLLTHWANPNFPLWKVSLSASSPITFPSQMLTFFCVRTWRSVPPSSIWSQGEVQGIRLAGGCFYLRSFSRPHPFSPLLNEDTSPLSLNEHFPFCLLHACELTTEPSDSGVMCPVSTWSSRGRKSSASLRQLQLHNDFKANQG